MDPAIDVLPLPGLPTAADRSVAHDPPDTDGPALPITTAAAAAFGARLVTAPATGCVLWTASISSNDGYGRISWRHQGRSRTVSAHRFALMLAHGGELPAGTIAEHACNEPLCVRVGPGHLHLSTQAGNARAAVARGRHTGPYPSPWCVRDRVARSRAVRDAVAGGWDEVAYLAAAYVGTRYADQPTLFDT
ncbi:MAG: HNH endonuclease [Tomitella sp.]|nr:HNH endonuclease [Tomitella sp.]